jgi:hypothetical protein
MIGVESPNNAKLFYNFNLEKKVRKEKKPGDRL